MILIVDDRPENLFSLKSVLQLHSFPVDTASSGEEALKKTLKNNYALIILDVQMPGMDGFEVAELLSDNNSTRDIPVIFLSAVNTEKKFITKGYSSGAIDYIVKPIDTDVLLLKVKTFYRLYEQKRELNEAHQKLQAEIEFRKKAQQQIQEKAMELNGILASIPQIAFTATQEGKVDFANSHWYNYSTGLDKFPMSHKDDPPVAEEWNQMLSAGNVVELETRISKLGSADFKYHLLRVVPVKENNKIVKWVGTFTDIEEQKQAINRKDDFLSMVSHELKTPLTSITGYMGLIAASAEGEMKNFTGRVLKQANKLHSLINDLLDLSKLKNGELHFEMHPLNAEELFASAIEMMRQIYPQHNIIYNGNAQVQIMGNALRLEQVLINFISNAAKYSLSNKEIEITTGITSDNGLYCSVKDWGIGISPEDQTAVFTKFYRVKDTLEGVQGLGIGLYICAEILKKHHAKYGVKSKLGEGSVFYFTIPVLNE